MSTPQPSGPQKIQNKNWTNQEGFLRVQQSGALRGNNFGTNQNFLTFGQWARSCRFHGEKLLAELSTPHSICPEKSFETNRFISPKKKVWLSFLILSEEIPDLMQKFSTKVSKTKSMWPEDKIDKIFFGRRYNFIFCDGFPEETLICKKTAGSSVGHSSRPVEHSKGRNSGRNKTFLTFGHWARIFWVSGRINLAELPKLHCMWAEQLLE